MKPYFFGKNHQGQDEFVMVGDIIETKNEQGALQGDVQNLDGQYLTHLLADYLVDKSEVKVVITNRENSRELLVFGGTVQRENNHVEITTERDGSLTKKLATFVSFDPSVKVVITVYRSKG